MTDFERLFSEGTPDRDKLTQNGFRETRNGYFRESPLCGFLLRIGVSVGGKVRAELYDADADAPYTLHFVESAGGSFVAEVRSAYERALKELAEKCFDHAVFTSRYAKRLVEYARKRYGEDCEFLWERTPDNGVLRRADNYKWYAAILTVAGNKVGLSTDDIVEIVDLRAEEGTVSELIHRRGFAPAWHMNKKSWLTVLLDGSVEFSTIARMLDESRLLAAARKPKKGKSE